MLKLHFVISSLLLMSAAGGSAFASPEHISEDNLSSLSLSIGPHVNAPPNRRTIRRRLLKIEPVTAPLAGMLSTDSTIKQGSSALASPERATLQEATKGLPESTRSANASSVDALRRRNSRGEDPAAPRDVTKSVGLAAHKNSTQNASNNRVPTLALALGGGGVRGAAHIGVLKVFEEEGIPIDYIVGSSMGSIVGGFYASGKSLDDISAVMTNGSLRRAYMPGLVTPKLLFSPLRKIIYPFDKHYAGIWSGKKFGSFLEKQLPRQVANVEDTPLPFSAVATDLLEGKTYTISNGKLSRAIQASSTIPALLQPVPIGNKLFVDGGVGANLPASAARATGADVVVAVVVDEPLEMRPPAFFRHLRGITARTTDVMLAEADARQAQFADVVIHPKVTGIPLIRGCPGDARKAIEAGERAARRALPEIRKLLGIASRQAVAAREGSETQ